MNKKQEEIKKETFKLPKYLKLDKGSMWFDTDGKDSSGVRLFAINKVLVGRDMKYKKLDNGKIHVVATEVPKDEYKNKNVLEYGTVKSDLPWYIDTTKIDPTKLSNILLAYKNGILVETDPDNPPKEVTDKKIVRQEFSVDSRGDRIFIGKNKEMFTKLQNLNFVKLRDFVKAAPKTETSKQNIFDLYTYEKRGYNALGRPRIEVLDLLKSKLKEFGNGISAITINDID